MNGRFTQKLVSIKDLSLWDENARFPDEYFGKTEQELIAYFLSKKYFKIRELAQAIVDDFNLPQMEKLIVLNRREKLVVLEGNRRLTVYKLLAEPSLCENESLKVFFEELSQELNENDVLNFKLECLITEDEQQGLRYINRKHLHNNYEVSWGENERFHYRARRGDAKNSELFKVAVAAEVSALSEIPYAMREGILSAGYVTTFNRIMCGSVARQFFGYQLDNARNLLTSDNKFREKLKVVISDVLRKADRFGSKIDSRALNKNKEIAKYLHSIDEDAFKEADARFEADRKQDLFGDPKPFNQPNGSTGVKSEPFSKTRAYLIPKSCVLNIKQTKINNVYHELKSRLLISEVPNAVGVLFRVFFGNKFGLLC